MSGPLGRVAPSELEIHHSDGEWSALYVRGNLNRVGDTYLITERVFELLEITELWDDAFMRGQDRRDGTAQTLDEASTYRTARAERLAQAEKLKDEAAELLQRAAELEGGAK